MPDDERLAPGAIAPEGGWYQELDASGKPTNIWVSVAQGDKLPASVANYFWRKAKLPSE